MTSEDLFAPTTLEYDPNTNYLEQLVGDGKKFSDPNKLGFSAMEKDRFIERLKSENAEMRKSINTSEKLEQLVTKLTPKTTSTSNDDNHNSERNDALPPVVNTAGLTPEQAEQLFQTKMNERDNFSKAIDGVKRAYGADYQTKLDAEAKKLGLNANEVNTLAKSNPELFLRIFQGTPQDTSMDFTPPSSSINPAYNSSTGKEMISGVRTEKYYADLKASDPKKYWSKAVQAQEYKDATKLGQSFFNA